MNFMKVISQDALITGIRVTLSNNSTLFSSKEIIVKGWNETISFDNMLKRRVCSGLLSVR